MPTYEYRCKECGHELEIQQSFTDDPLTECPACHGALRKVFGSVGISFKGSGFYKTDHGARSKSSTSSDSSSSGGSGDSSSNGSSDSGSSSSSTDSKSSPSSSGGSSGSSTKSESAA
jgi:putative FmdB family regulatory protein